MWTRERTPSLTVELTTSVVLDSYQLFNVAAKYDLIKSRMTVFINILNEAFIESVGYSTRGRNLKLD
jgi:vitamin B12 transporter